MTATPLGSSDDKGWRTESIELTLEGEHRIIFRIRLDNEKVNAALTNVSLTAGRCKDLPGITNI